MTTSTLPDSAAAEQYARDGYLICRGVFPYQEMVELSEEANRVFGRRDLIDVDNIRCRWQNHAETGECRFDTFDPVIDLSSVAERFARDPRILDKLSTLYGEEACLFKDKLIYKPPGATGYGLHQDYISWEKFPTSFVTVLASALGPVLMAECRDRGGSYAVAFYTLSAGVGMLALAAFTVQIPDRAVLSESAELVSTAFPSAIQPVPGTQT